ncbi:MAG: amidohydrolase family protein, partial [Anaerolineae bacterium]
GYTVGAAWATGQEDRTGSLSPGKAADLIVLSHDVFAVEPEELLQTEVLLTVFDGRIVYRSDAL